MTYADGTTSSITQNLSDWYRPENFAGESTASTMAYWVEWTPGNRQPTTDNGTPFVRLLLATNKVGTVQSIILPNNMNVVVLSLHLAL